MNWIDCLLVAAFVLLFLAAWFTLAWVNTPKCPQCKKRASTIFTEDGTPVLPGSHYGSWECLHCGIRFEVRNHDHMVTRQWKPK